MAQTVMPGASHEERAWWKHAVIYQIYPHSFCDASGDGIGDLRGITSKLDYLKDLGVDIVWLSPIYKSPQKDMGYDISDYRDINPDYGTLEDWEKLKDGLHQRGMKLMMDLVVNHTSDQHEWFKSSRSSKESPHRSWYHWQPSHPSSTPGNPRPPNNWLAMFRGEPAWTYDETTDEWYLRLYTKEQPDLNWENPEVRKAVYSLMTWWLEKGVDGFRMDVINLISKVPGYPDASITEPDSQYQLPFEHVTNGPRVHEFLQEMNREVLSKFDVIDVGETPFTHDIAKLVPYTQPQNRELQMVFAFEVHDIDGDPVSPMIPREFRLSEFKSILAKYQVGMWEQVGWNSSYLENHDLARSISRFADDSPQHRAASAKMLALLQCTLSGTVYVYQGQELGQKNVSENWRIEDFPDVATITWWNEVLEERRKRTGSPNPDMSDVLDGIRRKSRDNARTPMQWDASAPYAGFTPEGGAAPWMRIHEDYKEWNAAAQVRDDASVWSFWKGMLAFRKANPACTYGKFKLLFPEDAKLFCFTKTRTEQTLLVACNFSSEAVEYNLPDDQVPHTGAARLVKSTVTYKGKELAALAERKLQLGPWQGKAYEL